MEGEQSACISDDHNHDDTILSSLSARTKDTGRELAFVSELPDLAKIMDDDIQLVVWEQQEQPNFIKSLFSSQRHSMIQQYHQSVYLHSKGWYPHLPELVAEVIKKYIFLPYDIDIRSRPNVLTEAEADESADHVDKLVQLFADVAIQSGYIDGNVHGNVDELPFVHGRGDADAESIYGQPGIVHRSPRIEESGESRVILIIDIPQEGWRFD
eukprot:scaffold955_cov79-Skeletonema_dohrnii-CCMP3373.AAC.10